MVEVDMCPDCGEPIRGMTLSKDVTILDCPHGHVSMRVVAFDRLPAGVRDRALEALGFLADVATGRVKIETEADRARITPAIFLVKVGLELNGNLKP